jgi:intracellular sulfur oxidation DsrE/DsrF family protein
MKKLSLLLIAAFTCISAFSQTDSADKARNARRDSTLRATIHADSVRIEKQFQEEEKWEKMYAKAVSPLFKESKSSSVIPVADQTEVPDPNMEYKLLFELIVQNADSVKEDIDWGLAEAGRVINLHLASGIPQKKIIPVVVIHGSALSVVANNEYYKEKRKIDNPNIKLFNEMRSIGTKFIICGQAMTFFEMKKENFLPDVKVALTAQTILSAYQSKNYVLYKMDFK